MFSLVLSRCASFIPPSVSWIVAMAGLAFPVLWLVNLLLFALILMSKLRQITLILLILLLVTSPMMLKYYSISFSNGKKYYPYSILSYNVLGFSIPGEVSSQFTNMDSIHSFVNNHDFTVACFQEYPMKGAKHAQFYSKMTNDLKLPYKHISQYNPQERGTLFTLLTASEFPIIKQESLEYMSQPFAIYSDIVFPEDTVRIYNLHLQSIKLTGEKKLLNFHDENITPDNLIQHIKGAILKLRIAFLHRENQTARLIESLGKSPHPVILAGDLNDTPVSYTLAKISKGISDASMFRKNGFFRTYKLSAFPLKIDYLLHDKEIKVFKYTQFYSEISDHLAVSCNFSISH